MSTSKSIALIVLIAAILGFLFWRLKPFSELVVANWADATNRLSPELLQELAQLEARERRIAQTVWAKELLAQKCGRVFEQLWDNLNASSNKLQTLLSFPCDQLVLGQWEQIKHLAHGIEWRESKGQGRVLTSAEWRASLDQWQTEGWRLDRIEFRHTQFETDDAGKPRQSQFYFAAHLTNKPKETRALIDGTLGVHWTLDALPRVKQIDASALTLKTREGPPPFALVLSRDIPTGTRLTPIDPLMVCDLDLDGRSEIILAAANMVFRWGSAGRFESEPLIEQPLDWISSALLADFNADTRPDLLCARVEGLFLMRGSPDGKFIGPGERVWSPAPPLRNPMVMTCGDIDRDGDLDLFLAQYRHPYENGSMPTPFYNSNDGLPAYLLLNDGAGRFSDVTIGSGLESKRKRRTFSSSFTDLDGDGDLDLVVVSDFAGVDLYQNDSRGHFNEVTREWASEPHAFGMGHSLSDFNADGRLDLLMIGMTSPTVDRLEHLKLWRPDAIEDRTRRAAMAFGNRLYVARSGGGFEQTTLSESIARSGWSWGCSAFDWDNDGYPDVYIANGLESNRSVQEYEPEYWMHDRYVGQSQENPLAY
ncbi:MAG: VCBS repeat-containing protein, partial [Verrucomicrobiota bacterium]